jgi:nitrous oxide reductase accessory protein NosL
VFKDGSFAFFCGVKDMMKYYFDLPKYDPSRKASDISRIIATDYHSMNPTDGYQAYYVVGSVVFGPMGQEFFPFGEESSAWEFLRENSGKGMVRFHEITPDVFREMLKKY